MAETVEAIMKSSDCKSEEVKEEQRCTDGKSVEAKAEQRDCEKLPYAGLPLDDDHYLGGRTRTLPSPILARRKWRVQISL